MPLAMITEGPMRLIPCFLLSSLLCGTCLAEKVITISATGGGDFKTVQEGIAAAPAHSKERVQIHILPGTYHGPFIVPKDKPNLTFIGDDAATTILTWERNVQGPKPAGTSSFNPGLFVQADDFQAIHLTIENTSGDHGQGIALESDGDRDAFVQCRITGWQDTLFINNGRDYFRDCTIAGRVDFIYGSATSWFENCEIHSRNGGHVTAASTPQNHPYGYIFMNCKLTGDADAWDPATTNPATTMKAKVTPLADLGRPWRAYASVSFLNCEMGAHIAPHGWNNWGKAINETTARYSEYHNRGPGAAPDKRYPWIHQLSDDDAARVTLSNVIGGSDHWDPDAALAQYINAK